MRPGRVGRSAEVARAIAPGGQWRGKLSAVRRAAVRLAQAGRIDILRKGRPVDPAQEIAASSACVPARSRSPLRRVRPDASACSADRPAADVLLRDRRGPAGAAAAGFCRPGPAGDGQHRARRAGRIPPAPDIITRHYNVPPRQLYETLRRVALAQPRTFVHAAYDERLQAHFVARSRVFDFPDLIAVQVTPNPA